MQVLACFSALSDIRSVETCRLHGGGGVTILKRIYRRAAGMGYTFQASKYMNGYHFQFKSISMGYLFHPKRICMVNI